jgi:hypothetical protein
MSIVSDRWLVAIIFALIAVIVGQGVRIATHRDADSFSEKAIELATSADDA